MIDIKIKNYRITSDSRNFILGKKCIAKSDGKEHKKGEVFYQDFSFHSSLDSLIEKLVMLELKDLDITSLKELKDTIQSLRKWIMEELS